MKIEPFPGAGREQDHQRQPGGHDRDERKDANNNNAGSASARPDLTRRAVSRSAPRAQGPPKRSLLKIKEEKSIITRNEESLAQQREAAALGGGGEEEARGSSSKGVPGHHPVVRRG